MKKVSVALAMAAVACGFVSCTAQSPKADLKTDIDTLSYAVGLANTQGLKDYMVSSLGVDSAYVDDFIKGVLEGSSAKGDKKKIAYYAGLQIGQQVGGAMYQSITQQAFDGDSTKTLSRDNFMAGFIDGIKENTKVMDMPTAQATAQRKMEEVREMTLEAKYGENRKAGEEFLAKNAKKEGIQTLDGGVQYEVITEGKGAIPTVESKVKVNYKGTLLDGTEFDSSYQHDEPAVFRCNQVIAGWTTALTHMPVGSKWIVYIPQDMGYGSRQAGNIPPYSMLTFEIELISIEEN